MRRFVPIPLLAALALALIPAAPSGSAVGVRVGDNFFSPRSLSVSRDTTVVWRFRGSKCHDVFVTSGPVKFRSALKRTGSYSRKMTRRGTYRIVCTRHVMSQDAAGEVIGAEKAQSLRLFG